ncbi:hypothetical protein A3E42_03335 [Candidatus Gottesmanbacteria bacterium RIFCSPHIGHO2_12_FULL_40_13]|nr:MAG: hypothetical protein A3E42_03335 [Candidatus Gottesmanbacteria bacterium RIFCSPHIGHO2_12_FULL_40_13]
MSKIFLEILDKTGRDVFLQLRDFDKEGYLAGGTALALQINHRKSVDFDIFISKQINNKIRLKVKKIFGDIKYFVDTSDQISFYTKNQVSITVLWYYFNLLNKPISTKSIPLASVEDIMADKAYPVGRRAVWRDYVDFFLVIKKNILSLQKIIRFAEKKFSGEFNSALFLEQLTYFKDIKVMPIEYIGKSYTHDEVKSFLENQVNYYLNQVI